MFSETRRAVKRSGVEPDRPRYSPFEGRRLHKVSGSVHPAFSSAGEANATEERGDVSAVSASENAERKEEVAVLVAEPRELSSRDIGSPPARAYEMLVDPAEEGERALFSAAIIRGRSCGRSALLIGGSTGAPAGAVLLSRYKEVTVLVADMPPKLGGLD